MNEERSALIKLLGPIAALGLLVTIPQEESGGRLYLKAYKDIAGVWTVCDGITTGVGPNTVETREGCEKRLIHELVQRAGPVMACTPTLRRDIRDYQRWAAMSLAYNIGTNAYCRSSVARHFNAGRWREGCDAMLKWNKYRKYSGGPLLVSKGLTDRRRRERDICLKGL